MQGIKLTTKEWIKRAVNIHGNKYDYSKVEYKNKSSKVSIICLEHGEFWQEAGSHLKGCGCKKCGNKNIGIKNTKINNNIFIEKAKSVHGNQYDYSKVEYKNSKERVEIFCKEHNIYFKINPHNHLNGQGCRECMKQKISSKNSYTTSEFIKESKFVHGDKYDYSKVGYKNIFEKIVIICPKHGEFWQRPSDHLNTKCGCPKCNESKLERIVRLFLNKNNFAYNSQKTFDWLKNDESNCSLYLDFYLPKYNIAIECQGGQHFKSVKRFGGKKEFEKILKRDKIKYNLCKENGVDIFYFVNKSDYKEDYLDELHINLDKLFQLKIKTYDKEKSIERK